MSQVSSDKRAGVLVAAAVGDALGAGYEFGPPVPADRPVVMRGSAMFAPGEWTDDTAQMMALAMAAADGHDLATPDGEDAVAAYLQEWYLSPARLKDIGVHTSAVFAAVSTLPRPGLAERFRDAAADKEARSPGRSGGNGALMRTAPVALALHGDPGVMVRTAIRLGDMTHDDRRSSESCAVWCLAIRGALLGPAVWDAAALESWLDDLLHDIRHHLPESADFWVEQLLAARGRTPTDYFGHRPGNGYCVTTAVAALAAVLGTPIPERMPALHLRHAVEAAVRGGDDADTVACVTGALVGAMWGYSAVPLEWRRRTFGWPDLRDADLLRLAHLITSGGKREDEWPLAGHVPYDDYADTGSVAVHPHDDGVVIGGADVAYGRVPLPGGPVDAVVSLCRVGSADLDALGVGAQLRVEVRLIDQNGAEANPHLELVMADAADTVAALRAEGRRVLLHCVAAQSRTPTVAALYSARHLGIEPRRALAEVCAALPAASPRGDLARVVTG